MDYVDDLSDWIARQYQTAAKEILRSVSATNLSFRRPAFHQKMKPARGSILASSVSAPSDADPDYFFHWLRDSAIVIGAIEELIRDGTLGRQGEAVIADFVEFSRRLDALDGRKRVAAAYGAAVAPKARQYLRPREEMATIYGDRVRMEARFNPDGSLDVLRWGRPQMDGPALRALVLMRHARAPDASPQTRALIDADIGFTLRHAGERAYDIWEERNCGDYYTRLLQQRVLTEAAATATARNQTEDARALNGAAMRLEDLLDTHWASERMCYRSAAGGGAASDRDVDFAVVLASLHGGRNTGRHSVCDPRMQATLATLADIFAADYAINRQRPGAAPAMGRYRGDRYQSGGAFYFSTLGAAEFHYRLAATVASGNEIEITAENAHFLDLAGVVGHPPQDGELISALMARGDAFMETVKQFSPPSGALSEQFDQTDGRQTSARHLTWSYAAFISAAAARHRVLSFLVGAERREKGNRPG